MKPNGAYASPAPPPQRTQQAGGPRTAPRPRRPSARPAHPRQRRPWRAHARRPPSPQPLEPQPRRGWSCAPAGSQAGSAAGRRPPRARRRPCGATGAWPGARRTGLRLASSPRPGPTARPGGWPPADPGRRSVQRQPPLRPPPLYSRRQPRPRPRAHLHASRGAGRQAVRRCGSHERESTPVLGPCRTPWASHPCHEK